MFSGLLVSVDPVIPTIHGQLLAVYRPAVADAEEDVRRCATSFSVSRVESVLHRIPEFVGAAGSIRLPPRRDVPLSTRVVSVLDHPVFQRLRRVRQLGPLSLIYPGATHTRFEHSIGVYGLALDYFRALSRDPLAGSLSEADILVGLLGGLLHDVGHYPFAHNLEASHAGDFQATRHEELAADLIFGRVRLVGDEGPSLASIIEQSFGVAPEEVVSIIAQKASRHARPERRLVASVISSGMDADKSDYLERDALHMGLPFGGQFDRQRMLSALVVHPAGDRIALGLSGRMAAESFIFARYAMFSEGYWHHTARAVAAMVEEALRDLRRQKAGDERALTQGILQQDDEGFLESLRTQAAPGRAASSLLSGLTYGHRRLYKRVLTLTLAFADPSLRTAYDRVYDLDRSQLDALRASLRDVLEPLLGTRLQEWELLIDTPPRDKDHVEDIDLVSDGLAQPLAQSSQIVRGVAVDFVKVVKKIRVFVPPEARDILRARLPRKELQQVLVEAILRFDSGASQQQRLL